MCTLKLCIVSIITHTKKKRNSPISMRDEACMKELLSPCIKSLFVQGPTSKPCKLRAQTYLTPNPHSIKNVGVKTLTDEGGWGVGRGPLVSDRWRSYWWNGCTSRHVWAWSTMNGVIQKIKHLNSLNIQTPWSEFSYTVLVAILTSAYNWWGCRMWLVCRRKSCWCRSETCAVWKGSLVPEKAPLKSCCCSLTWTFKATKI